MTCETDKRKQKARTGTLPDASKTTCTCLTTFLFPMPRNLYSFVFSMPLTSLLTAASRVPSIETARERIGVSGAGIWCKQNKRHGQGELLFFELFSSCHLLSFFFLNSIFFPSLLRPFFLFSFWSSSLLPLGFSSSSRLNFFSLSFSFVPVPYSHRLVVSPKSLSLLCHFLVNCQSPVLHSFSDLYLYEGSASQEQIAPRHRTSHSHDPN